MLNADSNFTEANEKPVKQPVFVMSFADDPGSNQFINIDPVEEPEPAGGSHALIAVGDGQEVQISEDGITWTRIIVSGVRVNNSWVNVSGVTGRIFLHGLNSDSGGPTRVDQVFATAPGNIDPSLYLDNIYISRAFAEYGGEFFYNNDTEWVPQLESRYTADLDGAWTDLGLSGEYSAYLIPTPTRLLRLAYGIYQQSSDGRIFTNVTTMPQIAGQNITPMAVARDPDTGTLAMIARYSTTRRLFISEDDGMVWADRMAWTPGISDYANIMAFGNGRLVIVGLNGIYRYISIADLLGSGSLAGADISPFNDFHGLTYDSTVGLFIGVGQGGQIQTSPDGVNWTAQTPAGAYASTFRAVLGGFF